MCEVTECSGMQREMALAGMRALWAYVSGSLSNNYFRLFTAAPRDRAERLVDGWEQPGGLEDIDAASGPERSSRDPPRGLTSSIAGGRRARPPAPVWRFPSRGNAWPRMHPAGTTT